MILKILKSWTKIKHKLEIFNCKFNLTTELIIMSFHYRVPCWIFWPLLQWTMSISFIWQFLSSWVFLWKNGVSPYHRVFFQENYRFEYKEIDTKELFQNIRLNLIFFHCSSIEIIKRIWDFKHVCKYNSKYKN